MELKTSKLGLLEHSFDLLFEFSWFIASYWYLFSAHTLILCIFIILLIAFSRHVYDQYRRAMVKNFECARYSSNFVAIGVAEKRGVTFTFYEFMKIGLQVAVVSTAIANLMLISAFLL